MSGINQMQAQYKIFCEMFPNLAEGAHTYKDARNGAGIEIHLKDGIWVAFSYKKPSVWWLRTV